MPDHGSRFEDEVRVTQSFEWSAWAHPETRAGDTVGYVRGQISSPLFMWSAHTYIVALYERNRLSVAFYGVDLQHRTLIAVADG